ncbi:hypothetical protein Tco_0644388 [Tanacetum coccineum]
MVALYILDKLSEVAGSSLLEDKMKVALYILDKLSDAHSLIGGPGSAGDALKPLEYTREMVARDTTRVGVLEQLLVDAHVGMCLKAGYAYEM